VARRELRFILESSIKLCFVQQKNYGSTVEEKLAEFKGPLSSQRISIKDNLSMHMVRDELRNAFTEEVGRVYGLTSQYVHLTPTQILDRIEAVKAGRTAGKESSADVEHLNALASRTLAASLVLLLHTLQSRIGDETQAADAKT
jgi:hypothetical protein